MKKSLLAVAVAGAVLLSSAVQAQTTPEGYQLQQVLMMSRHNLRAPLANNGSVLAQSTPNAWPAWRRSRRATDDERRRAGSLYGTLHT